MNFKIKKKTQYYTYMKDIIEGKIVSCKSIKLAVARFVSDYEKSISDDDFPYYFDETSADNVIQFLSFLNFDTGKPFIVLDWQAFIVANLYGWKIKESGLRRFTKGFILVSRGNAKTTLGASLLAYDLMTNPSAVPTCLATSAKQSKIAMDACKKIFKSTPFLASKVELIQYEIRHKSTGSSIRSYANNPEQLDGLHSTTCLIDEAHEHKTKKLTNVMSSGQISVPEPLLLTISTAGFHIDYPIYDDYEFGKRVLNNEEEADDSFFLIYELDDADDEMNRQDCWIKANPSLGHFVNIRSFQSEYNKSKISDADRIGFLVKNLNVWTKEKVGGWIKPEYWEKVKDNEAIDEENLTGRTCYGGLDLSKVNDFSAFTLYFPPIDGEDKITALHKVFIPDKSIDEKERTDSFQIKKWIRQRYIHPTAGFSINYDEIADYIIECIEKYNVKEIGLDRTMVEPVLDRFFQLGKEQLFEDLFISIALQMKDISPLNKDWQQLILDNGLIDTNPVMEYCLSNCVVYTDETGNIKTNKISKNKRKDLVDTSVYAYSRLVENEGRGTRGQQYINDFYETINEVYGEDEKEKNTASKPSIEGSKSFYETLTNIYG